jgi:hypothetical protein
MISQFLLYALRVDLFILCSLFLHPIDILTDLPKVFLGSISVNTFPQLCNNKESSVLRAVPQRCNKHILAAANQHAEVEKDVFSVCLALT